MSHSLTTSSWVANNPSLCIVLSPLVCVSRSLILIRGPWWPLLCSWVCEPDTLWVRIWVFILAFMFSVCCFCSQCNCHLHLYGNPKRSSLWGIYNIMEYIKGIVFIRCNRIDWKCSILYSTCTQSSKGKQDSFWLSPLFIIDLSTPLSKMWFFFSDLCDGKSFELYPEVPRRFTWYPCDTKTVFGQVFWIII